MFEDASAAESALQLVADMLGGTLADVEGILANSEVPGYRILDPVFTPHVANSINEENRVISCLSVDATAVPGMSPGGDWAINKAHLALEAARPFYNKIKQAMVAQKFSTVESICGFKAMVFFVKRSAARYVEDSTMKLPKVAQNPNKIQDILVGSYNARTAGMAQESVEVLEELELEEQQAVQFPKVKYAQLAADLAKYARSAVGVSAAGRIPSAGHLGSLALDSVYDVYQKDVLGDLMQVAIISGLISASSLDMINAMRSCRAPSSARCPLMATTTGGMSSSHSGQMGRQWFSRTGSPTSDKGDPDLPTGGLF